MQRFVLTLGILAISAVQGLATDKPNHDPGLRVQPHDALELRLVLEDGDTKGKQFELDGQKLRVEPTPVINAKDVNSAFPVPDVGTFSISVKLTDEGGRKMRAFTDANVGKRLAIFTDGKILSAPVIQGPFGKEFQITGNFTLEEAEEIAQKLTKK
ncbi:MAG: hypothetical protein AAGA58_11580 [Verrucomicrobiota bacterium]